MHKADGALNIEAVNINVLDESEIQDSQRHLPSKRHGNHKTVLYQEPLSLHNEATQLSNTRFSVINQLKKTSASATKDFKGRKKASFSNMGGDLTKVIGGSPKKLSASASSPQPRQLGFTQKGPSVYKPAIENPE